MNKTLGLAALAAAIVAAGAVYYLFFSQPRLTQTQLDRALEAQRAAHGIQAAEAAENAAAPGAAQTAPAGAVSAKEPDQETQQKPAPAGAWPKEAPDVFKVRFECSHGDFVAEFHKEWAPLGVARFHELASANFYNGARFFRVVPGFMAQFGIPADPALAAEWRTRTIKDDPVKQKNVRGMITFAKTAAPNSRSTQLFINTGSNEFLDSQGFAPIGRVIEGMDVVERINAEYGETPNQQMIQMQGNAYLEQMFPKLDYIKRIVPVE